MQSLTVINRNGQLVIDSREVAEMTEVRHSDLLEKLDSYIQYLDNGKFRSADFFVPSTYNTGTRDYRCFLITRKGCDMVANKMTGEKGVLFTAAYVTKFEEMEKATKPQTQIQILQQAIDVLAEQERQILETKQIALQAKSGLDQAREAIGNIKYTMAELPKDKWRRWVNSSLGEIAYNAGNQSKNHEEIRSISYQLLEERARADLSARVRNARRRLEDAGATKTTVENYRKLDAIDEDKRLREIYTGIIKEMRIKHLV